MHATEILRMALNIPRIMLAKWADVSNVSKVAKFTTCTHWQFKTQVAAYRLSFYDCLIKLHIYPFCSRTTLEDLVVLPQFSILAQVTGQKLITLPVTLTNWAKRNDASRPATANLRPARQPPKWGAKRALQLFIMGKESGEGRVRAPGEAAKRGRVIEVVPATRWQVFCRQNYKPKPGRPR